MVTGVAAFTVEATTHLLTETNLTIEGISGRVRVQFSDDDQFHFDYDPEDYIVVFNTEGNEHHITVEAIMRQTTNLWGWVMNTAPDSEATIYIPNHLYENLALIVRSGMIEMEPETTVNANTFSAEVRSGMITLSSLDAETFLADIWSGMFRATSIAATDATATIRSGSFNASSITANTFTAELQSGSLTVASVDADEVTASVSSGSLRLHEVNTNIFTGSVTSGSFNVGSINDDADIDITGHGVAFVNGQRWQSQTSQQPPGWHFCKDTWQWIWR